MNLLSIAKDRSGVKYKYPSRTCSNCLKYPCFEGIKKCNSNFAAYGCTYYLEPQPKI